MAADPLMLAASGLSRLLVDLPRLAELFGDFDVEGEVVILREACPLDVKAALVAEEAARRPAKAKVSA